MKKAAWQVATWILVSVSASAAFSAEADTFLGAWALTLPSGQPGWLGVKSTDGQLSADLLWIAGSVYPVEQVAVDGDRLLFQRTRKRGSGRPGGGVNTTVDTFSARRVGDELHIEMVTVTNNGKPSRSEFTGKFCPPPGPKPNLSKVKFGEPIVLFDGSRLAGWELTNPNQVNGWTVQDDCLVNTPTQPEDGRHVSYGNLRTVEEFENFQLMLDVNVREGENSGIYLRGIYELQVASSYGREKSSTGSLGAIYSRVAPSKNAELPAGTWQTMIITLVDRYVTVVLNGTTIHDNVLLGGCTGGALWSDPFRPGPIYLQGDHTGIRYRNIVLTPIAE